MLGQPEPAYLAAPHGAPESRQGPARDPRRHPGRRRARSRSRPRTSSTSPCRSTATSTCSTQGWFWDTFEHPQRLKLLYLAAAYLNQNAWHQKLTGDLTPPRIERRRCRGLDAEANASRSRRPAWRSTRPRRWAGSRPTLESGLDPAPLVLPSRWPARGSATTRTTRKSRSACSRISARTGIRSKGRLLLAAAHHTARHRKYGDSAGLQPPLRQGAGRRGAELVADSSGPPAPASAEAKPPRLRAGRSSWLVILMPPRGGAFEQHHVDVRLTYVSTFG